VNLIIALGIFLAGFGAAWNWQGARAGVELAELRLDQSQAALDQVTTLVGKIRADQARADRITTAAAAREAALDEKLQETHRALKTATLGRPCLGNDALRLLDQSPGLRAPAGPPDGGRAAAAADPQGEGDEASDTDVAGWIAIAGRYYERCRGRLADIRAYEAGR
jgi:hypothetical protein